MKRKHNNPKGRDDNKVTAEYRDKEWMIIDKR
jgi:hypothetical protein